MKKIIIIVSIIILISIVLYGVYALFLKRTPERILKQIFDISLKDFDYCVDTFEEQWCPNGDGHVLIVYKFNKLTQENIDYLKEFDLKPLPISETDYLLMHSILEQFRNANNGYYLFRTGRITNYETSDGFKDEFALDFYIFTIDTESNMAVLYYSFM
jgi:hypothetical protein